MHNIIKALHQAGHQWRLHRWLALWLIGGGVVLGAGILVVQRTQSTLHVALANQQSVRVSGPLQLDFGQELAADFQPTIVPQVPGAWQKKRAVLGVSAVSFKPSGRFEAGRSYTLQVSGLKRAVTGAALPPISQTFVTQKPPAVEKSQPTAGAKDVSTKPRFTVTLGEANQGVRDLKPALLPEVALRLVSSDDRTFSWEPVTPLKQGAGYTFTLEDVRMATPEKRRLLSTAFTTVLQPGIASARTGGYFAPGQTIDIVFGLPMEASTNGFSFDLPGKGSWVDDHTYRYLPTAAGLKPGTTYNYVVKAGLKSKAGGVLEADVPLQFATTGAITASLSPSKGEAALTAAIKVAFDQPVNHASAEAHFTISPQVAGTFSWSGNTMTFNSAGLAYQSQYTYQVTPGVTPDWGLPNGRALAASFSTVPQTIKLGVPAYKTQYRMSCELASLRMLLGYRGVNVQDWDILMRIGYNPRPRDQATNTWDNPNLTYVGDIGGYPNTTGYGVHAAPIAAAAQSYGRGATASYNVSASFIAARIHEGNPLMFWGHSTPAKADAWNTSTGVVQTWLSSHARVVFGVVGRPDAPIGFYIIESASGTPVYWPTAQLMANMNVVPGVSNQVVVVY